MKKIYFSISILSFINLIFIGFGGYGSVEGKGITETKSNSKSLYVFNNDQVYRVGSKDNNVSEFYAIEITDEQESNELKITFNPLLTLELVKTQLISFNNDFPHLLIPSKINRYLLLQTLRL